ARHMTFTAELAERAATLAFTDLPPDVVEIACQCVLDWFAVSLAGLDEPVTRVLLEERSEHRVDGDFPTVVGTTTRLRPDDAALVNGAMSHALDYDDVNITMLGHPT